MKKTFFAFLVITCRLLLVSTSYAHIVESDNTVGAVMHIDPGDNPLALEKSTVILEFKDTKSIFSLDKCECLLTLNLADKQILQIPIPPVSGQDKLSAAIPITFPEKGVYELKISGKPKDEADFKTFELAYEVNVNEPREKPSDPQPAQESKSRVSEHTIHILGGLVILLFLIFALVKQSLNKK